MKTAVSIPDPIFRAAEREAKRQRIPRSRFYARALEAYLRSRHDQRITAAVDRALAGQETAADPALAEMQWRTLEKHLERW